jgi:hypothetical protein
MLVGHVVFPCLSFFSPDIVSISLFGIELWCQSTVCKLYERCMQLGEKGPEVKIRVVNVLMYFRANYPLIYFYDDARLSYV